MKNYFDGSWCHFVSSMDPLEQVSGRPYGGLGFICQNIPGVSFQEIACDTDRICGLEVSVSGSILFSVFGLYLPFNNHSRENIDLYTLKQLIDSRPSWSQL